jgi:two-component system sensor histidine kinase TctE
MIHAVDESSRSAGQLLDHAAVAYRTDDLARLPINLADLAKQTAAALDASAAMKDISLSLETEPVQVTGDPVLLENALRNVLDNAIKYSPEDTEVKIRLTRTAEHARISITDQGPGLGDGPARALTERFRRGNNTQGIVGSGLGLTIVEDVVSAHGGQVDLKTRDGGNGACVTLVLPL